MSERVDSEEKEEFRRMRELLSKAGRSVHYESEIRSFPKNITEEVPNDDNRSV